MRQMTLMSRHISGDTDSKNSRILLCMFLVREVSRGWRPVIDLKWLNYYIFSTLPDYHLLSSEYCKKGDFQNRSGDIPIEPDSKKYIHFSFQNKMYHPLVSTQPLCVGQLDSSGNAIVYPWQDLFFSNYCHHYAPLP